MVTPEAPRATERGGRRASTTSVTVASHGSWQLGVNLYTCLAHLVFYHRLMITMHHDSARDKCKKKMALNETNLACSVHQSIIPCSVSFGQVQLFYRLLLQCHSCNPTTRSFPPYPPSTRLTTTTTPRAPHITRCSLAMVCRAASFITRVQLAYSPNTIISGHLQRLEHSSSLR